VSSIGRPTPASPSRESSPYRSGPCTDNPRWCRRKKEEHPHLHTDKKQQEQKLERLRSTRLIRCDLRATNSRHANASKGYGLQHTYSYCTTLLTRLLVKIKLINMNRLANYAKHARVTHAIYGITSYHDYKIVNAIKQLLNFNHHIISCSTFELRKQASPMFEGVVEI
jgi:hypothetical protein